MELLRKWKETAQHQLEGLCKYLPQHPEPNPACGSTQERKQPSTRGPEQQQDNPGEVNISDAHTRHTFHRCAPSNSSTTKGVAASCLKDHTRACTEWETSGRRSKLLLPRWRPIQIVVSDWQSRPHKGLRTTCSPTTMPANCVVDRT